MGRSTLSDAFYWIWINGHRRYPGLGDYCRICDRETTSHARACPIRLAGTLSRSNK